MPLLRHRANCLIMLFFVVLLLISSIYCVEERTRVLNGIPVKGRNTGYNSVRYYAALATRHGIVHYKLPQSAFHGILPWYLLKKNYVEGRFLCSGALMTPQIVQTACHCLSTWQRSSSSTGHFRLPRVNQHWENVAVAYVGSNRRFGTSDSFENVTPLESTKYFIHRDCAKYREGVSANKYDFGWVRVKKDWLSGSTGVPIHAVDFMPMYTVAELKRIYQNALTKRLVCLRVGFGHWMSNIGTERDLSGVLRHGWGVVMPLAECYRILSANVTWEHVALHATWICATYFPKHNQSAGSGDSGGPFSCDNQLVGVVEGSFKRFVYKDKTRQGKYKRTIEFTGIYDPIYFAQFENAVEFRRYFEHYIDDYQHGESYVDVIRKKLEEAAEKSSRPLRRVFYGDHDASSSVGIWASIELCSFLSSMLIVASYQQRQ